MNTEQDKKSNEVTIFGRTIAASDLFKFIGLAAFFVIIVLICIFLWPYFSMIFEEDGVTRMVTSIREAGIAGVLILLALQFVQIVVAFIPGEVVQIAAGMVYGPWFGALIILVGVVISAAFIFVLVHRLGAPFVQSMVPEKYLDRFRDFEKTGRLNIIVFILFLIPGLPKDVFTYLVPLTDMRMRTFLILSTIGRIPGVLVSTFAAADLISGNIVRSIILFAIVAAIAILALVFYNRIVDFLANLRFRGKKMSTKKKASEGKEFSAVQDDFEDDEILEDQDNLLQEEEILAAADTVLKEDVTQKNRDRL